MLGGGAGALSILAALICGFGILQRYVLGEVTRAFSLALLTITAVFVLLTVMTKAASAGLEPLRDPQADPVHDPGELALHGAGVAPLLGDGRLRSAGG